MKGIIILAYCGAGAVVVRALTGAPGAAAVTFVLIAVLGGALLIGRRGPGGAR